MVDVINAGVSILVVLGSISAVDSTTSYTGRYPTQTYTMRFTMMVTPLAITEKSTVQLGGPEITFKRNNTISRLQVDIMDSVLSSMVCMYLYFLTFAHSQLLYVTI